MDSGKVLMVNLRTPDEETRNLLGSLLMTMFEQAALARESIPKPQRRRFFLFVDEFQKFTANEGSVTTLAEILSECRKYGLHLDLRPPELGAAIGPSAAVGRAGAGPGQGHLRQWAADGAEPGGIALLAEHRGDQARGGGPGPAGAHASAL